MKFIEILEQLFKNKKLQVKHEACEDWSYLINTADKDGENDDAGLHFLDMDGFAWWPDAEQIKSDRWQIKGKPLEKKIRNLFVSYEIGGVNTGGHWNGHWNGHWVGDPNFNALNIDNLESIVSRLAELNSVNLCNIRILNWKWLDE